MYNCLIYLGSAEGWMQFSTLLHDTWLEFPMLECQPRF